MGLALQLNAAHDLAPLFMPLAAAKTNSRCSAAERPNWIFPMASQPVSNEFEYTA
jgi:hypothetical protein